MASPEAVHALAEAIRYVVRTGVPGAIVECGVWRGGSMLAAATTLQEMGYTDRDLYLYDTFAGMPALTKKDVRWSGAAAAELLGSRAPLDEVKHVMSVADYPADRLRYVVGKVEDTIPRRMPESIAVLRLDTDGYESSRHELIHLYPRLSAGGVLILNDYAWWNGVGQATDEYFRAHPPAPFLARIDDSGARIAIKPGT